MNGYLEFLFCVVITVFEIVIIGGLILLFRELLK